MRFATFDAQGVRLSGSSTTGTPSGGSAPMAKYDRMDVGILALQQAYQAQDVYDFRVPGDPDKRTFQYKFPSDGFLLGVSITGSVSRSLNGGIFAQRTNPAGGNSVDVMQPTDEGNVQSYASTTFPKMGIMITTPTPIPFKRGELVNMKFKNMEDYSVTVNLAGYLVIGLVPQ